MALTPSEIAELDGSAALPDNEGSQIIQRIRQRHPKNPEAQRKIDIYDPTSEHRQHVILYHAALREGDADAETREMAWFRDGGYV